MNTIPSKVEYDASTNVYATAGVIQTGNDPDGHASTIEGWIDSYFEANPQAYQVRGYRLALADGLVEDSSYGRLAWMDVSNQGKLRSVNPTTWRRPREQCLTVSLYNATAHKDAIGDWPPLPAYLIVEGFMSWDDFAAAMPIVAAPSQPQPQGV